MWDIKLQLVSLIFTINSFNTSLLFTVFNTLDPYLLHGLFFFNLKIFYQFTQNVTVFFAIKFVIAIGFLILIRGGTPRYRYDYLTKLGWLKFLSLIILIFFSSLLTFFIF